MKRLNAEQIVASKWKNGRGYTRELDIYPESATLEDFAWRVSVADIDENADFSEFNGVDRIITLIHGNDITLSFDHGQQHLLKPLEPFPFKGEHKLKAVLHQGGVRDLNLMMSRKHVSGSVEALREAAKITCDPSCFYWLFCPTGHWQVKSETSKQSNVLELHAFDYLRFNPSLTQISLKPVTTDSALLVATIQPGADTE